MFDTQVLNHPSRTRLPSQNQTGKFCTPSHGKTRSLPRRSLPTLPNRLAPRRVTRRPSLQSATNSREQCRVQIEEISTALVCRKSSNGKRTQVATDTAFPSMDVRISQGNDANTFATTDTTNAHAANDATTTSAITTTKSTRAHGSYNTAYSACNRRGATRIAPKPNLIGPLLTHGSRQSRPRSANSRFYPFRFDSATESISRFRGLDSRHRRRKSPLKQASISAANTGVHKCHVGKSNGRRRVGPLKNVQCIPNAQNLVSSGAMLDDISHKTSERRHLLDIYRCIPTCFTAWK